MDKCELVDLMVLYLDDEGSLVCENMDNETLQLRLKERKGAGMDNCLRDKVTFLKNVPKCWHEHDVLILKNDVIAFDDTIMEKKNGT